MIGWTIAASIGLVVFSHIVPATADGPVQTPVSIDRDVARPDGPKYLLVQAAEPQPVESQKPQDQLSPAASSPPAETQTAEVPRAERTVPGCALKYMATELSGKLKGRKWKEFRQAECGPSSIEVVFPAGIAPKYSGDDPEKARTMTCADQFNANKASNGNGGMKWIEKGGGYYSECVVRLKG